MNYSQAVELMCRVSGWSRTEVERSPTDCLWAASGRLVEARDVIAAGKQRDHPSQGRNRGDL